MFANKYAYIMLVCASTSKGVGSELMQMAIAAASKMGCQSIALSTLPNAAGFYMGKFRFQFVSRNGLPIDTTKWLEDVTDEKGRTRKVLVPEKDVVDEFEEALRRFVDDRRENDSTRKANNKRKAAEAAEDEQNLQPGETAPKRGPVYWWGRFLSLLSPGEAQS